MLLDDDAYDRSRIRRFTEKSELSIDIEEAPTISAMSNLMKMETFDLIMIDYHLAEGDGLDALEMIQEHSGNRDAAVIMISGDGQSKTAVSAFRQGCHDFISKGDLSPAVLQRSVLGAMNTSRMGRVNQGNLADELKYQVRLALRESFEGDLFQSALTEGMRAAAKSIGMETVIQSPEFFQDFLDVDEFLFK